MPETEFTIAEVRAMERAAARAWPAAEAVDLFGWTWRYSGGGSRRANSVLPLAFSGSDPDAAIAEIEARYSARGLKTYFQVSSIAEPAGLDSRLAGRGYTYEEPCMLLAKRLAPPADVPAGVTVSDGPESAWLSIYGAELDPVRRAAAPAILASVPAARAFFLAHGYGEPMATALGVVSPDGIALVECVATHPTQRRKGAAQIVMNALEAWSIQQGAVIAALQVVEPNAPARALYTARGYAEAGRYHYRWRQL